MARHDKKDNKQELPVARVTTLLRGSTKNKFFDELDKNIAADSNIKSESKLASDIIEKYYR